LDRRADKQIARQEGALVRAVVRVWKAHERGHLLERVQHARVLRQAWEAWKRRLRHQGDLEGSHTFLQFHFLNLIHACSRNSAAALAFAQRSQVHVTSSAIQVWQRRFATQQGAQAFAVQYANAQLQFRILFKWRIQLRAHLKHFRQAKYADKLFVMRRAFRMWVQRSEEHGRETRLKEWNKGRAGKVFAGTSKIVVLARLWVEILWSLGWKEKALRQRRRRLAEQHRGHIPLRSATMHLWWTTRSTAPSTSHNFPRGSSLLPFIFLALCRPLQWYLRILILMGKPRRDFLRRDTCLPLVI
jgi:protein SFI1